MEMYSIDRVNVRYVYADVCVFFFHPFYPKRTEYNFMVKWKVRVKINIFMTYVMLGIRVLSIRFGIRLPSSSTV